MKTHFSFYKKIKQYLFLHYTPKIFLLQSAFHIALVNFLCQEPHATREIRRGPPLQI